MLVFKKINCLLLMGILLFGCKNKSVAPNNELKETTTSGNAAFATESTFEFDCAIPTNYIIPTEESIDMIKNFDTLYRKRGTGKLEAAFTLNHWIDTSILFSLNELLQSSDEYDGFRIYNAADPVLDDLSFRGLNYRSRSRVVLVPTKAKEDQHVDQWGKLMRYPRTDYDFKLFNLAEDQAQKTINAYGEVYRGEATPGDHLGEATTPELSCAVWFCKSILREFVRAATEGHYDIDGMNVYLAAYRAINTRVGGQKYPKQTTFLLVPTKREIFNHVDQWNIFENKGTLAQKNKVLGSYNHGQLCPNLCN